MDPTVKQIQSAYDNVPYTSSAFPQSHPDNLSVVAAVAGISAAPVTTCRVLEIGCAGGGNIAPMAETLPKSSFLGIDLSSRQIDAGNEFIRRAGLTNIELRCQDLVDFQSEHPFDYIIAHGLYSWIPSEIRDKLMDLCANNLSPQGLAFISYNTLPGWHMKRVARDMMLYHARNAKNATEAIANARQILPLASQGQPLLGSYRAAIQEGIDHLSKRDDWYLIHDDLSGINNPVYFEQFVSDAAAHGLRHVGASRPNMEQFNRLPAEIRRTLGENAKNAIEREQYADFIFGRTFRESILCRNSATVVSPNALDLAHKLYFASQATEEVMPNTGAASLTLRFATPQSVASMILAEPSFIAAMRTMTKSYPSAIPFSALLKAASAATPAGMTPDTLARPLAEYLLAAYRAEVVGLWTRPTDFIDVTPPPFPKATRVARLQAAAGDSVTNLRHQSLTSNAAILHFLPLLDGTRDHSALCRELAGIIERKEIDVKLPNGLPAATDDLNPYLNNLLRNLVRDSMLYNSANA